jgi:hypothetical protein
MTCDEVLILLIMIYLTILSIKDKVFPATRRGNFGSQMALRSALHATLFLYHAVEAHRVLRCWGFLSAQRWRCCQPYTPRYPYNRVVVKGYESSRLSDFLDRGLTDGGEFVGLARQTVAVTGRNRPWWSIWQWNIKAPTCSRNLAHRWRWGCQPCAPIYPCGGP